ncbi:MAG: lysine--tRNA ligase [Candidatus Lokiarchaeota archaeon]|nr:lysine--tRNA ligase [Candidatus Lokiarchaeota archaeon]
MSEDYPINWLDEIVEKILKRNESLVTLATGKTPSGFIHLGILREIIICDSIKRIMEEKGKEVRFYLFFDSLDAAVRFPDYIDQEFQIKYLGKPFSYIPCPFQDCQCESYAYHFGNDLSSNFPNFGISAEIIWTHELYKTKEMQEMIKIALENTDKIKEIIRKYILPTLDDEKKMSFLELQKGWMPVMVICEECDRIQHRKKDGTIKPNRAKEYLSDEQVVTYTCTSCGHLGKISIYSGRLKLNWRVDWPAKWALYKTTCEPAGKDHSVKGGAYDTGLELCQEIYNFIGPVKVPYEWLRLGDRDMKTSKGIVFTPKEFLKIADPEVFRTLILKTNPLKHISFRTEELPQYYDFYERMEEEFFLKVSSEGSDMVESRYLFPLTQIHEIPNKKSVRIPFKLLIFLAQVQNILSFEKLYEKAKEASKQDLFEEEISIETFKRLINQTTSWLSNVKEIIDTEENEKVKNEILRKINIFVIPETLDNNMLNSLTDTQKQGISSLRDYFINEKFYTPDLIQNKIFTIASEDIGITPRKLFEAIYTVILGKKSGPRLGSFLTLLDKNWLLERLDL